MESPSTVNTVKLAVCGLGLVGRRHLEAIEQVTGASCLDVGKCLVFASKRFRAGCSGTLK